MITVFNRSELITTYSMEEQSRVRARLAALGVPYTVKAVNRGGAEAIGSRRAYTGSLGERSGLSYEYVIYVKKSDLDSAQAALGDL